MPFQKIDGSAQAIFDGADGDSENIRGLSQCEPLIIVKMHNFARVFVELLDESVKLVCNFASGC